MREEVYFAESWFSEETTIPELVMLMKTVGEEYSDKSFM